MNEMQRNIAMWKEIYSGPMGDGCVFFGHVF